MIIERSQLESIEAGDSSNEWLASSDTEEDTTMPLIEQLMSRKHVVFHRSRQGRSKARPTNTLEKKFSESLLKSNCLSSNQSINTKTTKSSWKLSSIAGAQKSLGIKGALSKRVIPEVCYSPSPRILSKSPVFFSSWHRQQRMGKLRIFSPKRASLNHLIKSSTQNLPAFQRKKQFGGVSTQNKNLLLV